VISILLTDQIISLPDFMAQVESSSAGAVATFSGNVRTHDHGREVSTLSYEIHPQTETILSHVVAEVAARHKLISVSVAHRFGKIELGQSALIVAISAEHRGEAFAACAEMVDEIKAKIPIWKHQVFSDGTDEWVNCA
jgi:molybdopterin synthase catalytic subunit